MTPYQQLEARFARRGTLQEALAVLGWDHAAMMPAGGAKARAEQVSTLEVMAHDAALVRDGRPVIFTSLREDPLAAEVAAWVRAAVGKTALT